MRIVIAGGSGLLGRALVRRLVAQHHDVVILSRRTSKAARDGARTAVWTPDGSIGAWAREVDGADAVVNLAGAGIADTRWTPARKALLESSRILSTRSLVSAVQAASTRPGVFVQGSAIGYYGASLSERTHDEASPPGSDFFSRLAVEWEHEARPLAALGCRLVVIRTGVVLSRNGGALPPMARPFRFFVGGPVGSGRQYMSWISIDDWVALVTWAIATPAAHGPINATAARPVTNAEFSATLGRVLRRPALLPVPAFVLRVLFGEMADAILLGQRVVPVKAQALGFTFEHNDLEHAISHALRGPRRDQE
jgi:uncharacterized protein (TIGR01777 family)